LIIVRRPKPERFSIRPLVKAGDSKIGPENLVSLFPLIGKKVPADGDRVSFLLAINFLVMGPCNEPAYFKKTDRCNDLLRGKARSMND